MVKARCRILCWLRSFYSDYTLYVRSFLCVCAFIIAAVTSSAHAENLVSIKAHQLSDLSIKGKVSNILVLDDQITALGNDKAWVLNETEKAWEEYSWEQTGYIKGTIDGGLFSYLMVSSSPNGTITAVQKINREFNVATASSSIVVDNKLPPLPRPLASAQGVFFEGQVFIIGISPDNSLYTFAIDPSSNQPKWSLHEEGREFSGIVTSAVAQTSKLFVTVAGTDGGGDTLLQLHQGEGWLERSTLPGTVVVGSSQAMGQGHIVYIVKQASEHGPKASLMSFHTVTGSWTNYGNVKANAAEFSAGWKNGIIWGQLSDDGLGTTFSSVEFEVGKHLLHAIDWFIIAAYLFCMLGVGLYFYRRQAQGSQNDFFLGGRSIPFWAAGISLYASNASSISYIAVPAKAFETNWQYLMNNLIVVLGLVFVAVWIVPLLRRLDLVSIFQYLETRFHPSIRVLSSVLFIVFQLGGRMTIILFLPSLAISTVTGIDVVFSILIMGGITIIYTVLGGMKAVIWTDVIQLFVMFGGTIFAIFSIILLLDGGVSEFWQTAVLQDKMKLVDWRFDLTEATIWGFAFLVLFDTILTFPKDQVLMQRVLSTSSAKEAGRSVWTFAAIVIPGSVMFYLIGTALYVFYQKFPERMDPSLTIDATFPLFIAAELPIGVTGLIIAGIFAASMSTLSSILNSVATVATVDFYEKFVQSASEKSNVRFAEIITIIGGCIGVGLAIMLSLFEIHSLLDLALELWGLLGGGFAGAYTLGMFTRRANWQGVTIGVAVSIIATLGAWTVDLIHPYFYLPFSIFVCILVGYTASLLFPKPVSLNGLTIYKDPVS